MEIKSIACLLLLALASLSAPAQDLYVNVRTGNDTNPGNKLQPLKTIGEAAKRLNGNNMKGSATLFLAEGVYPLTETALFNNKKFTAADRLIIRAEILPGDLDWNPQRMPIITTVIPGVQRPGDGYEARGLEIETSHVTILGLRFTGSPDYYYIDGKQSRRYYPIWRDGKNLEDLLVTQCLFAGNVDVSPIRVAVIANGHGLVLDHCVFYNCENPVVFWNVEGETSYRNAMRYCLVYGCNYSGVWTTSSTADDLEFHHDIIANGKTGWIRDKSSTHHYQIHDCIITGNKNMAGYGNGEGTTDNGFLKMDNVELTGTIEIEKNQGSNDYLQLKEGSFGTYLKAGLFKK